MTQNHLKDRGEKNRRRMALFDSLMLHRVRNILLVASEYDAFTFEEDGRLNEALLTDYQELNLRFAPHITITSSVEEALEKLEQMPFDLVINILRIGNLEIAEFGKQVKQIAPAVPVVVLAYNSRELSVLQDMGTLEGIDRVYVWLGDVRIFVNIIKCIEDRLNAEHDIEQAGVQCIILIEDNVRFYSSYLPIIYTEIVKQTQALMSDAVNQMDRLLRMRARPKILLATTYEEGENLFLRYKKNVAGVILDASFPRGGKIDPSAGLSFARMVKSLTPDRPVVIQSSESQNKAAARSLAANFINKRSSTLLADVRQFIDDHLGFGDFVFRLSSGDALRSAGDLKSLVEGLSEIPVESLLFHAGRNDFSTWLMARTQFDLARKIRGVIPESFDDPESLRAHMIQVFVSHRDQAYAGVIADFSPDTFVPTKSSFVRIGRGSLGGKGRGLAFMNTLLDRYQIRHKLPDLEITVPPTAVLATDAFDRFMQQSDLLAFALGNAADQEIAQAFLQARLPMDVTTSLRAYLEEVDYPLAVRSSSLLEDASHQPFAGIYRTLMIPNSHERLDERLAQLERAIKFVYASTYFADAKAYISATPNRLEEEKMAVIIQKISGAKRENLFYPDMAGVARSHNHYPMQGMKAEEGVVSVVLGLGQMVVEGGRSVRFSPAHPRRLYQFSSPQDTLESAQREFFALNLDDQTLHLEQADESPNIVTNHLDVADKHGVLPSVGSVYSPANNAVYDGTSRPGVPLVTFAGVLKADIFPLAEAMSLLLELSSRGFSSPVEVEFAANIRPDRQGLHSLDFLQVRPVVVGFSQKEVSIQAVDTQNAVCVSQNALGTGAITEVRDIIYVAKEHFDRSKTQEIANEIGEINGRLRAANRPTLLVGPGRWGTQDRWLGIPVSWNQIAGVKCIIETDMDDISVSPSQGSHFFQNITSFGIGYFTVSFDEPEDLLDSDWLSATNAKKETKYVRHLSFEDPLEIIVNGRENIGVVMKPGCSLLDPKE